MRILIVYPNIGLQVTMNHGIAALAAALKQAGHEVSLLHLGTFHLDRVLRQVEKAAPEVVAISLTENHRRQMELLATGLRTRTKDIRIFAGGPFPSAYRE